MVTQIYTPLIPQINRASLPQRNPGALAPIGEDAGNPSDGFNSEQQSRGLAHLPQDSASGRMALGSILSDFKSTMDAIGTTEDVRKEVDAYLNIVQLQGEKDRPAVQLIQQSLRTAADALDQFISQALSQRSQVVRDWVDALLAQPIDYQQVTPTPGTLTQSFQALTSPTSEKTNSELPSTSANAPEQALSLKQFKQHLHQIKANLKSGKLEDAQQALEALLTEIPDTEKPWQLRAYHLLGKVSDRLKQPEKAFSAYSTALELATTLGNTTQQAQLHHTLGSLSETLKQPNQALSHYQAAITLDKEANRWIEAAQGLNQAGSLHLLQADLLQAKASFAEAYRILNTVEEQDPTLLADVLSNIGALYRSEKKPMGAEKAYQKILKLARSTKDSMLAVQTYQQLAQLYLESNAPQKAMHALSRSQQFATI